MATLDTGLVGGFFETPNSFRDFRVPKRKPFKFLRFGKGSAEAFPAHMEDVNDFVPREVKFVSVGPNVLVLEVTDGSDPNNISFSGHMFDMSHSAL